jgi:hypothetical protein
MCCGCPITAVLGQRGWDSSLMVTPTSAAAAAAPAALTQHWWWCVQSNGGGAAAASRLLLLTMARPAHSSLMVPSAMASVGRGGRVDSAARQHAETQQGREAGGGGVGIKTNNLHSEAGRGVAGQHRRKTACGLGRSNN